MENIYYSPEKFGLQEVAEIDYSDGDYQFDLRVVWYHQNSNTFYTARDSGCSCPAPFEDYRGLNDLDTLDYGALHREAIGEASSDSGYYSYHITMDEAHSFLDKVRNSMVNVRKLAIKKLQTAKVDLPSPGICMSAAELRKMKELMDTYNEFKEMWVEKFGSVDGFDAWFTQQVEE